MDKIVIWAQEGGSVVRWPKFWAKSSKRAGEKVAERIRGRNLQKFAEKGLKKIFKRSFLFSSKDRHSKTKIKLNIHF
jgi:hypothetical protein